jgi:Rrf2 family protein
MRISTKGRYGLAVMLCIAGKRESNQTVADISKKLGVSKIYLEQVFGLLKTAGLLQSVKGSQGGYFLTAAPDAVTVYAVLKATEAALFEPTEKSLSGEAEHLERIVQDFVWKPLGDTVSGALQAVTLQDLLDVSQKAAEYMFFI